MTDSKKHKVEVINIYRIPRSYWEDEKDWSLEKFKEDSIKNNKHLKFTQEHSYIDAYAYGDYVCLEVIGDIQEDFKDKCFSEDSYICWKEETEDWTDEQFELNDRKSAALYEYSKLARED